MSIFDVAIFDKKGEYFRGFFYVVRSKDSKALIVNQKKKIGLIKYRKISFYEVYIITALGKTILSALKNRNREHKNWVYDNVQK